MIQNLKHYLKWSVEGNTYTIKYKNKMWHSNRVRLVDFEKEN